MKIKSLFAAVSLVALSAGTAHALAVVPVIAGSGPGPNPVPAATNTGDVLALELDLATANVNGLYDFDIVRGAGVGGVAGIGFPTGTALTVTLTLPAGRVINGNATGLSITSATAANAGAGGLGNVTAGGTAGSNTITYTINVANPNDNVLQIRGLPVSATADVNGAPFTVSVIANGAEIDATVATDVTTAPGVLPASVATVFADSAPAVVAGVVASDAGASNTQVALPGYTTLLENGGAVGAGVQTPLGTINYTLPGALVSLLNPAGTAVAKSPFVVGDVTSITMNVQPSRSTTGLGSAAVLGITVAPAAGTYAFTIPGGTAGLFGGGADVVSISSAAAGPGVAPILSQGVAVANATINLNSTPGRTFLASVPGANGQLDPLDRQGQAFGPFDWNGSAGTNSVYRVTGLPAGGTTGTATFTNTVGGANGTFPFAITAADAADGEAVLSSFGGFNTGNTAFTRTDVTLNFEVPLVGPGAGVLDVDRLMARNGIISAFGDGSNFNLATGTSADSDNVNGSE